MRIVDYNTFVELPKGTIYSEYEPCNFGDIQIKHDVLKNEEGFIFDWYYQDLVNNPDWDCAENYDIYDVCKVLENGKSVLPDFEIISRDGMFDYDRKFLIYEKNDIELFIEKLQECLNLAEI